ncbi:hypothetical protein BG004_002263 [Podila humilis]|nr:hypothetical protein BG004_002263 [Podila humilis]
MASQAPPPLPPHEQHPPSEAETSSLLIPLIVPVPEIDSSMEIPTLNPGECLVKYFEDNTYSVVPMTDLQPFVPTTIPFLEYELAAGQKFLKNGGVVNALAYLETGKVKRKFSWHRFGTAQGPDLGIEMNKSKPISLPVVSDAAFAAQGLKSSTVASSASSSPATSTANYTDTESDAKDEPSESAAHKKPSSARRVPAGLNTKGLRGSGPQSATLSSSASASGLASALASLPSQSDDTEFNSRSTKVKSEVTAPKDSQNGRTGRSRRGSRDTETAAKTTTTSVTSEAGTSPASASEDNNVDTDSTSSSGINSNTNTKKPSAQVKRSRTTSEQPSPTTAAQQRRKSSTSAVASLFADPANNNTGQTDASMSRQGSPQLSTSPRSTRPSRSAKVSDLGIQGQDDSANGGSEGSNSADTLSPNHEEAPKPQRTTRTRSVPKSGRSLSKSDVKDTKSDTLIVGTQAEEQQESKDQRDGALGRSVLISSIAPSLFHSSPLSSSSAISSPSSTTAEEELPGLSGVSSASSSSSSLSSTLEQERRDLSFSFEHVFPTLAIGSKEREAFYEACMDHLQNLRREHRRLKQIIQSCEPKSRRGTRSSPNRNGHLNHYHSSQRGQSPFASSFTSSSYYTSTSTRSGAAASATAGSSTAGQASGSNGSLSGTGGPSSPSSIESLASNGSSLSNNASGSNGTNAGTQAAPSSGKHGTATTTTTTATMTVTATATPGRRSAATAAAAAVTATVSRSSRQSNNSQSSVAHEVVQSKKRTAATSGAEGGSREVQTRAKRRLR